MYLYTFGITSCYDPLSKDLATALRITGTVAIAITNFYLGCAARQLKTLADLRDLSDSCTNKLNHMLVTQPELCAVIAQAI